MHLKFRENSTQSRFLRRTLLAFTAAAMAVVIAAPAAADPPPWAPAYGYYGKHKGKHGKAKHQRDVVRVGDYRAPFDLNIGRCNRALLGGVLGVATGAVIGSQIGDGDGRTVAIISGAVIGAVVGGSIGHSMDQIDQNCVGQALEHTPDGETITWNSADASDRYQVTPTRTYQISGGRYCREYQTRGLIDGREQELYGTACRQPDGSWELGG